MKEQYSKNSKVQAWSEWMSQCQNFDESREMTAEEKQKLRKYCFIFFSFLAAAFAFLAIVMTIADKAG